jgi:hypothetical protein
LLPTSFVAVVATLLVGVGAWGLVGRAAAQGCEGGREVGARTDGRCCWPGQSWSRDAGVCTGVPDCPEGTTADDATCVPALVSACTEGRVATAETLGRCCWPGQHWNAPDAICEGPPRCPPTLVEDGDSCIASGAATIPAAEPALPSSTTTVVGPAYGAPGGAEPPPTSLERETQSVIWLQVTGILTWATAYLAGIGITAAIGASGGEVGILAIPFAGPWICFAACIEPGPYAPALVADGVVQLAGTVLFVLGSVLQTEVTATDIAFVPWIGPDGTGALVTTPF